VVLGVIIVSGGVVVALGGAVVPLGGAVTTPVDDGANAHHSNSANTTSATIQAHLGMPLDRFDPVEDVVFDDVDMVVPSSGVL